MKIHQTFSWYGGKRSHLPFLYAHFLEKSGVEHFVGLFGCSTQVIINAGPSPTETFNDWDKEVANFFKVLQDDWDELIRKLELTPFACRELLCYTHSPLNRYRYDNEEITKRYNSFEEAEDTLVWAVCSGFLCPEMYAPEIIEREYL